MFRRWGSVECNGKGMERRFSDSSCSSGGNPARGVAPCGLQAIACDPPTTCRKLGLFSG